MPQKKGCIPWNKGLTREKDSRIKSSIRKIYFSDHEKDKIIFLYSKGLSPTEVGNKFGCSSHPIVDFLNSINLIRNLSEWRIKTAQQQKERIYQYSYNNISLKIIDGFINKKTKKLHSVAKIQTECNNCKKSFIITFNGYKSKLKHNNNIIYCNSCSRLLAWLRHDRRVKTSSQQKIICDMIGATLNYKINEMYTDMALENEKIIIEYDGWVWHGNKKIQARDRRRDEYLKSIGWKILRIKSNKKIPDKIQIENSLTILRNNKHTYTEIVLDDWGKTKTIC
jgi:very-short-patch-repair endonuclease